MKIFYNNNNGVLLVSVIFIITMYLIAILCPCDRNTECMRNEFYGVQFNHLIFFIFVGFYFPSYFFTWQFLGILVELIEYWLDNNDNFVVKYVGGCLAEKPEDLTYNPIHNYIVYKGENKYLNPIDRYFGIENSKIHAWHGSIAEVVLNIFAFGIGYYLNKLYFKNKKN
jgi:ABC-type multidrug transport system permease subunit